MATRGRKRRQIDYNEVKLLASVFSSEEEIADRLGFAYSGFRERKERDKELLAALKRGRSDAIRSLRALQFQSAKKGNVSMQIWLGKQYLNQSDKAAIEQSIEHLGVLHQLMVDPEYAREVAERMGVRRGLSMKQHEASASGDNTEPSSRPNSSLQKD